MNILVVSNMYPDVKNPSYGIFVKKFCDEIKRIGINYDLSVMRKSTTKLKKMIRYIFFHISTFLKCIIFDYDIVYVHYASYSSFGVLCARKIKKFKIYTNLHGSDVVPENKRQEKMHNYTIKIINLSDRIVVPSAYFKNLVSEKYDIEKKEIYVYPSAGVDLSIFHNFGKEENDRVKKRLNLDSQLKTYGTAGRISFAKGWDTFIEAICLVKQNGYKANFVIIGDGPETRSLKDKIEEQGISENIVFVNKLITQEELAKYYSALDWFVFPTKREGESLGLVAIESMACGTPVIASNFAAPKYYVINGKNGYKFEMGDAQSLATIIMKTLSKGEDKNCFSEGLESTVQKFTSENTIEVLKDIFAKEG